MSSAARLDNRLSFVLCALSSWLEQLETDKLLARRRLRSDQRRELERLLDTTERATSRRLGGGWRVTWPEDAILTGHDARIALGLALHAAAFARKHETGVRSTSAPHPRNRQRLPPKSLR
ncbi:hypothetical protein [Devosia sp.]|uniref:hypothetical protein n=1 Tax=Devosia sp. TaxID=1871048 RepID=UPI003A93F5D8